MNTTVKRLFSLLLCLMMCLAVLPTTALADEPTTTPITTGNVNITAPVAGQHPSFTATADSGLNIIPGVVHWFKVLGEGSTTEINASDTFIEGQKYDVTIQLGAAAGFHISTTNSISINNNNNENNRTGWSGNGTIRTCRFIAAPASGGSTPSGGGSGSSTYTSIEFKLGDNKYAYGKPVADAASLAVYFDGNTNNQANDLEVCTTTYHDDLNSARNGTPTSDEDFVAGKGYYARIVFKAGADITLNLDTTQGSTSTSLSLGQPAVMAEHPEFQSSNDGYIAIFPLPELRANPLPILFKSVVTKGGNVTPPAGSFELEVLDCNGAALGEGYTVESTDFNTPSGAGTTNQQLTIKHNNYTTMLDQLVRSGIIVREKNSGVDGWTYDDTAWLVKVGNSTSLASLTNETNEEQTPATLPDGLIFKFYEAELTDNGWVADDGDAAEYETAMTFTNKYTKNTSSSSSSSSKKPKEKVEIVIVKDNPETGAVGMPMQTVASLAGVVLVAGAAAYISKKHMK